MNLLVCCASGMSSSLLVQKMRQTVKDQGLNDIKIGSCSKDQLSKYLEEADVILVAPQLEFYFDEIKEKVAPYQKQVLAISSQDYGEMNAISIINSILHPIEESKDLSTSKIELLQVKIYPYAKRIASSRVLNAISKAFMSIMPITVIGSIMTLIVNLPIKSFNDMIYYLNINELLDMGIDATLNMISLYMAFFVSYHFVKSYRLASHGAGLISLSSFLLITGRSDMGYSLKYLGAKGVFTALLVGLITGYLYTKIIQKHIVRLPDKIPPQVTHSLETIVPFLIITILFLVLTLVMANTRYGDFNTMIYELIQSNLMKFMGNNIFSYILYQFSTNILWFFGVHGGNVMGSITNPIFTPLSLENFNAYQSGLELPNIINGAFGKCFIQGGVGSMLSLCILMTFLARSKRYRAIGKIALPTCIFFINEPILFGVPVVLNPLFFIPLLFITPILSVLTYFVMSIGIIPFTNGAQIPWTTPPVIYGFLQGSWKIALWEIMTLILAMMMWYPFFKIADTQAYAEENNPCHN